MFITTDKSVVFIMLIGRNKSVLSGAPERYDEFDDRNDFWPFHMRHK